MANAANTHTHTHMPTHRSSLPTMDYTCMQCEMSSEDLALNSFLLLYANYKTKITDFQKQ